MLWLESQVCLVVPCVWTIIGILRNCNLELGSKSFIPNWKPKTIPKQGFITGNRIFIPSACLLLSEKLATPQLTVADGRNGDGRTADSPLVKPASASRRAVDSPSRSPTAMLGLGVCRIGRRTAAVVMMVGRGRSGIVRWASLLLKAHV